MNLAVFGDSWPVGTELNKGEMPFGDLLHKKLGTKNYYNQAEQGSTIDSLVIQLDKFFCATQKLPDTLPPIRHRDDQRRRRVRQTG